jgi:hypothetical protein
MNLYKPLSGSNLPPGLDVNSVTLAPASPARLPVALSSRKGTFSLGSWLLLLGLNGYFILPFLFSTDISSPAILGTQRFYYVTYICLVLGGLLEGRRLQDGLRRYRRHMIWAWLFLAATILMMIRSMAQGESVGRILWNAVAYFSLIAFVLAGQNSNIWSTLNKVFIAHTFVGSAYILWILLSSGVSSRSGMVSLSSYTLIFKGANIIPVPLYAGPILMYSYAIQPRMGKLAAIFGYLASLLVYFFYQSRIGIGVSIIQILILAVILWRSRKIRRIKLRKTAYGLLSVVLVLLVVYNLSGRSSGLGNQLSQAQYLLYQRFMSGVGMDTLSDASRWAEASIVSEQLTWDEWLLGRGVAATWSDPRLFMGQLRTMVHIGYFNFLFYGGILLLLLMLVPLVWGMGALLGSRDLLTLAASGYVIQYYATIVMYGYPSDSLVWMLFGLAVGRCALFVMQPSKVSRRTRLNSIMKK